jgi:hypothetical protein
MLFDDSTLDMLGIPELDDAATEESSDFLTGGMEIQYPQLVWFSGLAGKNPIVEKAGANEWAETDQQAIGAWIEVSKTPEKLQEIAAKLAEKGVVKFAHIQHDDGKVKEYWAINDPKYLVLAHGIPSQWQVMHFDKTEAKWVHNTEKELGIARGTMTIEHKDINKQSTYNFISCLVIVKQLADLYVDEDGNPLPLLMSFKSLNVRVVHDALTAHYGFIADQRKWYAGELLENKAFKARYKGKKEEELKRIASAIANRHCQFWSYYLPLDRSKVRKEHKAGANNQNGGSQKVYEPENKAAATLLYNNRPSAEEALYCGDALYVKVRNYVLDTSVQPPAPGGMAIDYCRERVARAVENQNTLNKYGNNEFGSKKTRPDWMAQQSSRASHGIVEDETGIPESLRSNPTPAAPNAQARTQLKLRMGKIEHLHKIFEANACEEGFIILPELNEALEEVGLSDTRKAEMAQNALNAGNAVLARLKEELQDAFVDVEAPRRF